MLEHLFCCIEVVHHDWKQLVLVVASPGIIMKHATARYVRILVQDVSAKNCFRTCASSRSHMLVQIRKTKKKRSNVFVRSLSCNFSCSWLPHGCVLEYALTAGQYMFTNGVL